MKDCAGAGEGLPEWFESVVEAQKYFGCSDHAVARWVQSGEVEGGLKDPSRKASKHNPRRVNRKSLEEALIRKGMHPDEWPDPTVQRWVDPIPPMASADHLRADQVGNVGEHLVAYYLSFCNASVSLVDRRGMDHFVRLPNGEMFALEVKTASKPVPAYKGADALRCWFGISRTDADWFALLDLSTNIFLLRKKEEFSVDRNYSVPHRFFTPFYMNQSIQRLFESYGCEPEPVV